jgi:hypothetical protein
MKKQELKKVLKPLIKECIKEVILEEGILSSVVSEVVQGLGAPTIVEAKAPVSKPHNQQAAIEQRNQKLMEQKNKLLSAINTEAYGGIDVFEGTSPLSGGGSAEQEATSQGPLSNMDPHDPGVDITGILGIAGNRWAAHLK